MSNFKFAFVSLIVSLIFISCQRDGVSPNPQTGGNSATSYNPTTVGSWWKYKDSATGTLSTTTIANRTKTINGILYSAMVSDIASDTAWASSPQPNYYTYAKGVSPNTGASYDILFHYLNDTASVGYNWRYTAGQGKLYCLYTYHNSGAQYKHVRSWQILQ